MPVVLIWAIPGAVAASAWLRPSWPSPVTSTSPARRIRSAHWLAGRNWHDCPADANGTRAIRFGYDPTTSRDGTMVAGHPAILTLLIDDSGQIVPGAKNYGQDQQQNGQQACGGNHHGANRQSIEQPWQHQRREHRTAAKAGERPGDVVTRKVYNLATRARVARKREVLDAWAAELRRIMARPEVVAVDGAELRLVA